jgi:hypothetical protein
MMRNNINKMKKYSKIISILIGSLLFFVTGCATIVHGPNELVLVDSSPVRSNLIVDNLYNTRGTPAVLVLKRNSVHTIVFSAAGYQDQTLTLVPEISGWVFGNLIFTPLLGVIGAVIDFSDGAAYSLSSNHALVLLNSK